jgi:manganese efflux pump family protein
VLALLLVAVAVALSNFAAAIAIGVSGTDPSLRLRVGLVFGLFEAAMPLVGLVIGHGLAHRLGTSGQIVGGVLLAVTGIYTIFSALRHGEPEIPAGRLGTGRLVVTGAALSIDNLVIGFALGTYRVPIVAAAILIGVVSVSLSIVGLELGSRLGTVIGERAEVVGGAVLVLVGLGVGGGWI